MSGAPPRTVIIYARVSTEDQAREGTSLQDQDRVLRAWAASNGWTVAGSFEDAGVSGTTPPHRRPGLLAAMEALAGLDGQGSPALVVTKRDRLAREMAVAVALEQAAKEHGATVLSMDAGNEDTAESRLLRQILDAFAEYERTKILMRTAAGRAARAREGRWLGGTPPWGMKHGASAGTLVVESVEAAELIRHVFEEHQAGVSYSGIAAWLNAKGVATREGGTWTHTQVRRMVMAEQWYRRGGVL